MAMTGSGLPALPFGDRRVPHFVASRASAAVPDVVSYEISTRQSAAADVIVPWPWAWCFVMTDAAWVAGNTTDGGILITSNDTGQPLCAAVIDKDNHFATYIIGGRPMPMTPRGIKIDVLNAGGIANNGTLYVSMISLDWWLGGSSPASFQGTARTIGSQNVPAGLPT